MNNTIHQLLEHRSIRSYLDKPVEQEKLDLVLEAARHAPNWVNMQQWSVIVVRDKERKQKLAQLAGGQKHIEQAPVFLVFCADFGRVAVACEKQGVDMGSVMTNIDNVVIAGQEVGIAVATAVVAAESMGLGTVPIGNVRFSVPQIVELLQVPQYAIPLCGLCVGYADGDPGKKPRLPREAVCFEETYTRTDDAFKPVLDKYDEEYGVYLAERGGNNRAGSWSKTVSDYVKYSHNRFPALEEMFARQNIYSKKR